MFHQIYLNSLEQYGQGGGGGGESLGLLSLQLAFEGLWHLGGRGAGQSEGDLDSIVDEPLGGSEGTNHDNTSKQSLPHAHEAEVLGDLSSRRTLGLVELGNDGVSRVRDDGTEHTSDVTGSKGDHQLFRLGAFITRLGDDILVEGFDGLLKAGKLHHGVGDLSAPQGHQTLVEAIHTLILHDLGGTFPQGAGESRHGLDADLNCFHGGEGNISEELCGGRGCKVEASPVDVGILLTQDTSIHVLEDLIEAKLADTLHGVADGCGGPALGQTTSSLLGNRYLETIEDALVLGSIHLDTALDQIEGDNHGVCDTTAEKTSQTTQGIVLLAAKLNLS